MKYLRGMYISTKYYFWYFVAGVCFHLGEFCCMLGFLDAGAWFRSKIVACTFRGQVRKNR